MNPVAKRIVTGLSISALVVLAVVFAPPCVVMPVAAVLALLAIIEFAMLLRQKVGGRCGAGVGVGLLIGAAFIAGGIWALPAIALKYGNLMLLYILAIVKFSDTGGFAFGLTSAKLMKGGNHKLCPTISPAKSWEGLLGSVVFSCVVSVAFVAIARSARAAHFVDFSIAKALAFGVIAALVGTLGDLIESKFKRWVGVKDSSTLKFTNGMGGILDMFDSLLIAPAVLLAAL